MSVSITITNAGLAKLINAQATGTAAIAVAQIGISATAITPDPTLTALTGELFRTSGISGLVVAPDTIHVVMQDTSANAYTAQSFAIYLADGTLFAIYGQTTPIFVKTAASIGLLAIDITFASALAGSISFGNADFINPPASETIKGVVQLATLAQAQAGTDAADVLTPSTAAIAVISWLTGKSLLLGKIDVATPNDGTTGGLRLRGNATSGLAYVQVTDPTGEAEWGHWKHSALGEADWTGGQLRRAGHALWDNGNDGAGSGLDADVFHGMTPDQLMAAYFSSGSNANGTWEKRPNAIMEQWGAVEFTTQYESPSFGRGAYTINFAQPFKDTKYSLNLTPHNPQQHYDNGTWPQIVSKSVGSCVIYNMWTGGGDGTIYGVDWRAIGAFA